MTLDKAIQHCQEVAEEQDKLCKINDDFNFSQPRWRECAKEHRQLAEWLKELRYLRNLVSFAEYHNVPIKRAKEELSRHEVTE